MRHGRHSGHAGNPLVDTRDEVEISAVGVCDDEDTVAKTAVAKSRKLLRSMMDDEVREKTVRVSCVGLEEVLVRVVV